MPESLPKFAPLKIGGFTTWEPQIVTYLRFKGWFKIVEGNTKKPTAKDPMATTKDEQDTIDDWDDINQHAAGTITLALAPEEVAALRTSLNTAVGLWTAIKVCHITDKSVTRYNTWYEFFNLRLAPGEVLDAFAGRVQEVMHCIQERRPNSGYDIATQDSELIIHAMLRGLSDDKSCKTLVATLLGDMTKLASITSLRKRLVNEDISHDTTPNLYGLKKSDHRVLLASTAPTTTACAGPATTNKPNENKKECAKCTYEGCSSHHPTESCYKKIIADLKSRINDMSAVTKSVRFNNSTHSAATTTTAAALSVNTGSLTMARAQLPSFDNVADGLWIADTVATAHMTPHRAFFVTYEPCSNPGCVANGNIVHASGVGTVAFVPRQGGVDTPAVGFTKVLHVPDLQCNLLSVQYLVRNSGIVVHAEGDSMSFAQNGTVLFIVATPVSVTNFLMLISEVISNMK